MMYLGRFNGTTHEIFDSYTNTFDSVTDEKLLEMSNHGVYIINTDIKDGKIEANEWVASMNKKYVFIGFIDKETVKLFNFSRHAVCITGSTDYTRLLTNGEVANFNKDTENRRVKLCDYCDLTVKDKFKAYIKAEYAKFIAKTKLMGLDNSFKYEIEGNDVRIIAYIGKSKKVILPKFITAIGNESFEYTGVTSITLNEGLKAIGKYAFYSCGIKQLIVPSTVEHIFLSAFESNDHLMIDDERINEKNLIISNKNTVLI